MIRRLLHRYFPAEPMTWAGFFLTATAFAKEMGETSANLRAPFKGASRCQAEGCGVLFFSQVPTDRCVRCRRAA